MSFLIKKKLIDVQVGELTETARVILISNSKKNAKMQSDSQKIVFDSKIQFLRSAEYDHRLKIKNVVVADQKQILTKAFAIVACLV